MSDEAVCHGGRSFPSRANSNRDGSLQSSIGGDSYRGSNGYSLRLEGLESGINALGRPAISRLRLHIAAILAPSLGDTARTFLAARDGW